MVKRPAGQFLLTMGAIFVAIGFLWVYEAYSAHYYSAAYNTTTPMYVGSVCYQSYNTCSVNSMLVSANTSAEWQSALKKAPACLNLTTAADACATCGVGCSDGGTTTGSDGSSSGDGGGY